jgi:hypothetical protein
MEPISYEAPTAKPASYSASRVIQWSLTGLLIVSTLFTGTPLVLFAGYYWHFRTTNPPLPPGDPDIGFGILMLLGLLNLPVALAWITLLIWLIIRRR